MDKLLPSEILAKIASNLSYKDVNSLLRTSKTAHAKLTPYRHILPKIPCCVKVRWRAHYRYGDEICLVVRYGAWRKFANFYDHRESGVDELTEEENRDRVVRFYKDSQDPTEEEENVNLGRLEGLSLHMQTILSFASIEEIKLEYIDDDLILEELARLMGQSRSRIDRIVIYSKAFRSSHLDLITACKPRELTVSGEVQLVQLPDDFYNLPAIQRLDLLEVNSHERTVHNLWFISASDIRIWKPHIITINDIGQIILQRAESKRRIEKIFIDFSKSLNKKKCQNWIRRLNSTLVQVKLDTTQENWLLTRRCDGAKIKFEVSHNSLVIRIGV